MIAPPLLVFAGGVLFVILGLVYAIVPRMVVTFNSNVFRAAGRDGMAKKASAKSQVWQVRLAGGASIVVGVLLVLFQAYSSM